MHRRTLYASLAALLLLSAFLAPATTHGTAANHLLISEVLYDPATSEPQTEFVELYNPTGQPVSIGGWALKDNLSTDTLPQAEIGAGQFLVVTDNEAEFRAANPGFSGTLVSLGAPIGNGLGNSGDAVVLLDTEGAAIDAMSYGSDTSVFDPPCPDVPEGQSLSRTTTDADSDTASDWSSGTPTPGGPWAPPIEPTATNTATAGITPSATASHSPTPSPTTTPVAGPWPELLVSEVYYDPPQSGSDSSYEFVEIYNTTGQRVDVSGWRLGDNGAEDVLPAAYVEARGYLVVAASRDGFMGNFPSFTGNLAVLEGTIGNGLSNTGDRVSLAAPDGTVIDKMSYGSDTSGFEPACPDVAAGQSLARVPSGHDSNSASDWHEQTEPNPGAAGRIMNTPTPTPSPTVTRTSTADSTTTPTATSTPSSTYTPGPTETGDPTATPSFTPSPTPTGTVYRYKIFLSEVMYDPVEEGSDADWEWVEIYNGADGTVALSGWRIGDNNNQDAVPDLTLAPGAYAVIAAKEAAFRGSYPTFSGPMVSLEGNIGNGLSNTGDTVRLIAPDATLVDAMSYGSDKSAFDPPCDTVSPGESISRWNFADTDSAADWTSDSAPSPGTAIKVTPTPTGTRTPGPTPVTTTLPPSALRVTLNEVLPDPESVDWDRDGQTGFLDEWIELYNGADTNVALEGWIIGDDSGSYKMPVGTVIWPRGFLLLYRSQTRLSLGDVRDVVTLTRSDGTLADQFTYNGGPGHDRSYCREGDGDGPWTGDCATTPGGPNRLLPEPPPAPPGPTPRPITTSSVPHTIARARAVQEDSRVVITGSVTLPPGLIAKTIYVQDATGGVRVYLRNGEYPAMNVGDQVRITGWTRSFYGETELSVPDVSYMSVIGRGKAPPAKPITSAGLSESNEGLFVQVIGMVVKYETRALVLKDGGGLIRIYFPESLPWRRPYVNIGEMWAAQGVLAQHAEEKSTNAGYEILPRFKSDVVRGPGFLPTTGGATGGPTLP